MLILCSIDGYALQVERFAPGQQFVGDAAQGILVTFDADSAVKHFGGHVGWGASTAHLHRASRRKDSRQAKVGKQSFAFGIEEDVIGFEVAMNDVLLVG